MLYDYIHVCVSGGKLGALSHALLGWRREGGEEWISLILHTCSAPKEHICITFDDALKRDINFTYKCTVCPHIACI